MAILLKERLESFEDFEPGRVSRDGLSQVQTHEFIVKEISRYLDWYRELERMDQTARLLRDQIDGLLRRYHDYMIQGRIRAHYRQVGINTKKGNVFEHVIPARTVRNLLISKNIDLNQALNSPTCLVSPEVNKMLEKYKLGKNSPNVWWFWRRYENLGIEIETFDGNPVNIHTWNLAQHYDYFSSFGQYSAT